MRFVLAVALCLPATASAFESPLAAGRYAEGVAFTNDGHGANRLRGVGADLISYKDDVWILWGATLYAPATEADRADVNAAVLRWGIVLAETPSEGSGGIDPLMGFFQLTFDLFHASLSDEARNGLGAGLELGIYGLLPPKGVLYYRIGACADGGHLVTQDDAFALLSGEISIGLMLAP
jgi:hypothetical protein